MTEAEESALTFPCEFPIKAMGKAGCELDSIVVGIVRRHTPDLAEGAIAGPLAGKQGVHLIYRPPGKRE